MALGTPDLSFNSLRAPSAGINVDVMTFTGDTAYAAGGTEEFSAFLKTALGREIEILAVLGYSIQGTTQPHTVHYDRENDKLQVFLADTAAEAGAGDLSAATFHVTIVSQ